MNCDGCDSKKHLLLLLILLLIYTYRRVHVVRGLFKSRHNMIEDRSLGAKAPLNRGYVPNGDL